MTHTVRQDCGDRRDCRGLCGARRRGCGVARARVEPGAGAEAPRSAADLRARWARRRSPTRTSRTLRKSIRCLINEERAVHGFGKLLRNESLQKAAQRHTKAMVAADCLAHRCGDEPNLETRLRQAGYFDGVKAWRYAENTGCGESAEAMVANWLASLYHRVNILDPDFEDIGVGVSQERVRVAVTRGTDVRGRLRRAHPLARRPSLAPETQACANVRADFVPDGLPRRKTASRPAGARLRDLATRARGLAGHARRCRQRLRQSAAKSNPDSLSTGRGSRRNPLPGQPAARQGRPSEPRSRQEASEGRPAPQRAHGRHRLFRPRL